MSRDNLKTFFVVTGYFHKGSEYNSFGSVLNLLYSTSSQKEKVREDVE